MKLKLTFVHILVAVVVLIAAIFVIVGILNSRSAARDAARTSEAVATITDTQSIFTSYNHKTLSVKYNYTVDGRSYQGETSKGTNVSWSPFVVGKTAKACYNPAHPSESDVWPLSYSCAH
jgi:type II secretory pathway pseudopilin PulG